MLQPVMLLGLGTVAVWMHVTQPRLRPTSILRAAAHVALSFFGFTSVPTALGLLLPRLPSDVLLPYAVLILLIPTLTYLLVSWVWLIGRILHDLGGKPSGGHPVLSA
jgi:hypothetical protein